MTDSRISPPESAADELSCSQPSLGTSSSCLYDTRVPLFPLFLSNPLPRSIFKKGSEEVMFDDEVLHTQLLSTLMVCKDGRSDRDNTY